ncbi:hypothetical protein CLOSTHATH_06484, partial [Hungatella hathewayi DSM 13479]
MAGIVGVGIQVPRERQLADNGLHAQKLSENLIVDAVFHRLRPADTENLLKCAGFIHTLQHHARQITDEDGLGHIDAAGYKRERLTGENEIRQFLLAAVLRITADQKAGAIDVTRAKQCDIQTAAF